MNRIPIPTKTSHAANQNMAFWQQQKNTHKKKQKINMELKNDDLEEYYPLKRNYTVYVQVLC